MHLNVKISDLKRQIEIAAMVSEQSNRYSKYELAHEFNVSEARIHRDMAELRRMGVDIHSCKNRYSINGGEKALNSLLRLYVALSETGAVTTAEHAYSPYMLAQAVKLNRAIEFRQNIQILHDDVWKVIKPTGLCYDNNEYCLIAEHRNKNTLFPLNRIKNIRYAENTFN